MKLKTINFLKNLEAGIYLEVEDNGIFSIFSPHKDKNENFRDSGWWETIEEAEKYIGIMSGYLPEYIDNKIDNWIIKPHRLKHAPMSGKVLICDNAEEECKSNGYGWSDEMKEMVGNIFEVKNDCGGNCFINGCVFPKSCLMYPIEEETGKDEWIKKGEKEGWIKDHIMFKSVMDNK